MYIYLYIYITLYRTKGDGNCLYRACSKLLCGKDELHGVLRYLTSIELFTNQEFYAFHPYIKKNVHLFKCENTAFSASASDAALGDGYDRKDPSSRVVVVQREAVKNLTSGAYASLMCLFALSSVTGMDVISVYPEELDHKTKYSKFQNETILPRNAHKDFSSKLVQESKLIFMWTTAGFLTLPGLAQGFQPNHFVPLVEFNSKTETKAKRIQQKKITDHFKFCSQSENELFIRGNV